MNTDQAATNYTKESNIYASVLTSHFTLRVQPVSTASIVAHRGKALFEAALTTHGVHGDAAFRPNHLYDAQAHNWEFEIVRAEHPHTKLLATHAYLKMFFENASESSSVTRYSKEEECGLALHSSQRTHEFINTVNHGKPATILDTDSDYDQHLSMSHSWSDVFPSVPGSMKSERWQWETQVHVDPIVYTRILTHRLLLLPHLLPIFCWCAALSLCKLWIIGNWHNMLTCVRAFRLCKKLIYRLLRRVDGIVRDTFGHEEDPFSLGRDVAVCIRVYREMHEESIFDAVADEEQRLVAIMEYFDEVEEGL
ncbi:hypothetical protein C8Q76DRAFT_690212 [Earliella scabrosa]|nr:hypothetical protein C8Q76DRAFT_690212 [Earliella scabrosa]